ncbi:unnamed protein product [Lota lota]
MWSNQKHNGSSINPESTYRESDNRRSIISESSNKSNNSESSNESNYSEPIIRESSNKSNNSESSNESNYSEPIIRESSNESDNSGHIISEYRPQHPDTKLHHRGAGESGRAVRWRNRRSCHRFDGRRGCLG